jgi:hypothetical protein
MSRCPTNARRASRRRTRSDNQRRSRSARAGRALHGERTVLRARFDSCGSYTLLRCDHPTRLVWGVVKIKRLWGNFDLLQFAFAIDDYIRCLQAEGREVWFYEGGRLLETRSSQRLCL